jgi:hypothetical protein
VPLWSIFALTRYLHNRLRTSLALRVAVGAVPVRHFEACGSLSRHGPVAGEVPEEVTVCVWRCVAQFEELVQRQEPLTRFI